jgi:cytolysin-activating lysine-acyltransferase
MTRGPQDAGTTEVGTTDKDAPFATPENRMVEAMMADLMAGPFKDQSFKLHKTDPKTGKRSVLTLTG